MALPYHLKVVTAADLTRIHDATLEILQKKGVLFHCGEAVALFKQHGARAEGKVVRFPEQMVEQALESCPAQYQFSARNQRRAVTVGQGIVVATNAGSLYIQDLVGRRRPGTLRDYANIQKLYQASPVIDIVGYTPVDTGDVDPRIKHLHMTYEALRQTDKPIICHLNDRKKTRQMLDMVAIAFGSATLPQDRHVTGVGINPVSPLSYSREACETMLEYARSNQALFMAPAPMTGISSPIRPAGTVVLQNAEALAGIVLVQLANPGNPVVYMPGGLVGGMQDGNCITGSPEMMLMNAANIQLARDLYHLPTRSQCGITDAKGIDVQAGYETMQNMMMSMAAGVNMFHLPVGVLDSIFTVSLEKMIIDEEILNRVLRIHQGLDLSSTALSEMVIHEVAHGGMYLDHADTLDHFRRQWTPSVSIWEPYERWQKQGSPEVVQRAHEIVRQRLASAPESLMDADTERALQDYMRSVQ